MNRHAIPVLALALAACAGAPSARVTTAEERADLLALLSSIETALGVMHGTGKIPTSDYQLATAQVADLRAAVAASEAKPVSAVDLLNRVLGLAAAWAIAVETRK